MRLSLALVLLTSLVVTNYAQEEPDRNLRRGEGRGRIFKRYSNDPGGDDDEDVSVIVRCARFTENKCFEDLKAVTDGPPIKIVHQLEGTDFFAIKMKRSQATTINSMDEVVEITDDPIRDLMHIEESYRIETRQLEGQTIPYGISLVKADKVWDRTKGAGAKVCIIDTGLYLNQEDFAPKDRFDGATNDAEGIYDWVRSKGFVLSASKHRYFSRANILWLLLLRLSYCSTKMDMATELTLPVPLARLITTSALWVSHPKPKSLLSASLVTMADFVLVAS
jgi:hypothetical protein